MERLKKVLVFAKTLGENLKLSREIDRILKGVTSRFPNTRATLQSIAEFTGKEMHRIDQEDGPNSPLIPVFESTLDQFKHLSANLNYPITRNRYIDTLRRQFITHLRQEKRRNGKNGGNGKRDLAEYLVPKKIEN